MSSILPCISLILFFWHRDPRSVYPYLHHILIASIYAYKLVPPYPLHLTLSDPPSPRFTSCSICNLWWYKYDGMSLIILGHVSDVVRLSFLGLSSSSVQAICLIPITRHYSSKGSTIGVFTILPLYAACSLLKASSNCLYMLLRRSRAFSRRRYR